MSLRSRFALAFAAVGAVVAVTVGALSYLAASDSVFAEVDRTLRSTTVALTRGMEKRQEQTPADPTDPTDQADPTGPADPADPADPVGPSPGGGDTGTRTPAPFPGLDLPAPGVKRHRSRSCRPWAGTARPSA